MVLGFHFFNGLSCCCCHCSKPPTFPGALGRLLNPGLFASSAEWHKQPYRRECRWDSDFNPAGDANPQNQEDTEDPAGCFLRYLEPFTVPLFGSKEINRLFSTWLCPVSTHSTIMCGILSWVYKQELADLFCVIVSRHHSPQILQQHIHELYSVKTNNSKTRDSY